MFVSESHIKELASLISGDIVEALLPASRRGSLKGSSNKVLQKSSLRESSDEVSPDDVAAAEDIRDAARRPPRHPVTLDPMPEPAKPHPFDDPLSAIPQRPPVPHGEFPPPDFEDTYDINRPPGPPSHFAPGYRPFGDIGADDLNPPGLGPHDPLRPGRVMPGRAGEARGMHPTIPSLEGWDHQPSTGEGDLGFDQQVPPGARYDPIGPGGHPRFGGGRPGRGGVGNNPFGGFGGGDII